MITLTMGEWVSLLSPLANVILVAFVIPTINQSRQTQTQLALLRYQVALLMRRNGIEAPEEPLPTG